jgi:hypothetical protein
VEAPVGTEVTLSVRATEPLEVAQMTIGAESVPMTIAADVHAPNSGTAVARFTVRESKRYAIRMASRAGVSGAFRGGSIRATADRPPVVLVRDTASRDRDAGERELLPIAFQAADDYGLSRLDAELTVTRAAGGATRLSTAVPIARGAKQEQGVFTLDVRALGAVRGDAMELRFRAEDRAGQFALSVPLRWKVIAPSVSNRPHEPVAPVVPSTQHAEPAVPVDPPGFEDPLRAYFDALRDGGATRGGKVSPD